MGAEKSAKNKGVLSAGGRFGALFCTGYCTASTKKPGTTVKMMPGLVASLSFVVREKSGLTDQLVIICDEQFVNVSLLRV
jgi:hypothetical protein